MGCPWTSTSTVLSTVRTWRSSRVSSARPSELLGFFARHHVVVETEGHPFARLREILRQRRQRAAGGESVRRGLVERRKAGGPDGVNAADRHLVVRDEALADPAPDPLPGGQGNALVPVVADLEIDAPRVVSPGKPLGVERHRAVAPAA